MAPVFTLVPRTRTVSIWSPGVAPNVHFVEARPEESVTTRAGAIAPLETLNVTGASGTAFP